MINSTNTVEFSLSNSDKANLVPPPGMVPSGKINPIHTSTIPQNNVRFFSNYSVEPLNPYSAYSTSSDTVIARAINCTSKTKDIKTPESGDPHHAHSRLNKERVKVQLLQTHPKLQNNRWNCHTFYNLSAETEREIPNNNNNIQNESAFIIECYQMDGKSPSNTSAGTEGNNNNNNNNNRPAAAAKPLRADQQFTGDTNANTIASDRHESPIHRTEDQENAFRRIEDVHNYAKLNRCSYSNGSSNSSVHEDEEEEEEEEDDEVVDDDEIDYANVDLSSANKNFETFFRNRQPEQSVAKAIKTLRSGEKNIIKLYRDEVEETESTHVDVETVQREPFEETETSVAVVTPDHHARRPMNAFLIFCKRHRAIVKDRYRSLENRAITKILGDWWASLDVNDKKCFTSLAQQNKDAFFSANPNFKWYKLPAPPLRTLNTRPSNTERALLDQEAEDDFSVTPAAKSRSGNFFKLADEAQMGELSTLMSEKSSNNSMTQLALQQALGETTKFLSSHMPQHNLVDQQAAIEKIGKRRLHSENSFSSNSSEDDGVPKKSSRSCKGKIYQELINSGQIAAITKKVKTPKAISCHEPNGFMRQDTVTAHQQHQHLHAAATPDTCSAIAAAKRTVTVSESDSSQHYDLATFDLEEKIKELPALSLDAYLQRKRNTKKKKKFTSKKRNSHSVSSSKSSPSTASVTHSPPITPPKERREQAPQQAAAVGSQKRKARKESITRRDVSAIENEVASLIPLTKDYTTINGCYYFNETLSVVPKAMASPAIVATTNTAAPFAAASPPTQQFCSGFSNFNDSISSTSDLLILAEVAANRTELTN